MATQFAALRPPTVRKDKKRTKTGEVETRWKASFYDHAGKRRRKFFHSKSEAETAARIVQNRQLNEGIHASKIAPGLREEAIACEKLLEGTGLTMRQAIELGMKHQPKATDKTVAVILEEFLTNRETIRNNRKRTIDEYRGQLGKFAKDFGHRLIDSITATEIEKWLAKMHIDYKGRKRVWGGERRNKTRGYISTLFTFALNRKWCTTNPAKGVDRAIVEKPPIEVWNPTEVELILKVASRDCPEILNFLILALFSGIRTCELLLLLKEHVQVADGIILVPAHISKTRKLRRVPISENLAAWLTKTNIQNESGRIISANGSSLLRNGLPREDGR